MVGIVNSPGYSTYNGNAPRWFNVQGGESIVRQLYDADRLQGSTVNNSGFAGNASPVSLLRDPKDTWKSIEDDEIWNNGQLYAYPNTAKQQPYYDPFSSINQAKAENARRQEVANSWKDVDYIIKNNIRVDPLAGVREYHANHAPDPVPKTGQNTTNYMSNDDFRKYYELNKNTFNKADPNISMQEHYANWLRNKNYLPEAYKEQPGFFSQLGQGLMDNFTKNPLGFAGGLFDLYQGFKQAGYMKDYYNTQKDLFNTQKEIMLNNERRNQEQWDMLKRQRASSSL